jgi:hypothetical protein
LISMVFSSSIDCPATDPAAVVERLFAPVRFCHRYWYRKSTGP